MRLLKDLISRSLQYGTLKSHISIVAQSYNMPNSLE